MSLQYTPRHCRSCGQWISAELIKEKRIKKGQRVSVALRENRKNGDPVGRWTDRPDKEIIRLRDQGLTMRMISHQLNISLAKVQRALKKTNPHAKY